LMGETAANANAKMAFIMMLNLYELACVDNGREQGFVLQQTCVNTT
jgi:hypothetical protein